MVATSNESPTDLEPAVLDRFEIVLRCDVPHVGIYESLPPEWSRLLKSHYDGQPEQTVELPLTARRAMAAAKLAEAMSDEDVALMCVFGTKSIEMASVLASARATLKS